MISYRYLHTMMWVSHTVVALTLRRRILLLKRRFAWGVHNMYKLFCLFCLYLYAHIGIYNMNMYLLIYIGLLIDR